MKLYGIVTLVTALLKHLGRISYRTLKFQFDLDDEQLEALKVEIIEAQGIAADQDGKFLVWNGNITSALPLAKAASESIDTTAVDNAATPPHFAVIEGTAIREEVSPVAVAEVPAVDAKLTLKADEAERRQITVMFCDLAESTKLSSQIDPEDYREVIRTYQKTSAEVIQSFDGYIAQYLGDGLLVYFGFPQAHEDDAKRAAHAGLGIIDAMNGLNSRIENNKSMQLKVRVGIHTGLAIVGEIGGGNRRELMALGETLNIAARLEGQAAPNTVVISETTARLVQGAFEVEDLGDHRLKGIAEPVRVTRVLRPFDQMIEEKAAATGHRFPLVGRDEELGLLRRRWEQSKEGLGQIVLITGEAGIGKTRLVETIKDHVAGEGFSHILFLCSPYHTNSMLYPVISHLQRFLQIQSEDPPSIKIGKLEAALKNYNLPKAEVVPLFADLLSIPLPEHYPAPVLTSQQLRQQTLDALVAWLLDEAEKRALLGIWEDLQLADPTTLELLGLVIDQAPTVPFLNVLTFRPEFVPPWPARSHMTPITLNRLERPETLAMITNLADRKALPVEVVEHIVTKTDGVPLFVEELTKMLLESGLLRENINQYELVGSLSDVAIPATLQDSLMARLDRLPAVREVAQLAAVLGREFAYEMLQAITDEEDTTLQKGLAKLVETEMLYQRGRAPQARYVFKHAMVRDAAYDTLLHSTRQNYHQQIARMLETRFSENLAMEPELVAHHYTEAEQYDEAIPFWHQAGKRAIERSANIEAVNHLKKGLDVLKKLPDTTERTHQELQLLTTLGPVLMSTKGYAAAETESVYIRAKELCQQLGEAPQLFPVVAGLWRFYLLRAEYSIAQEFAEQLLSLANLTQNRVFLLEASRALGSTLFYRGKLAEARSHLEQGMTLYDPQEHRDLAFHYGQDPGVACCSYASWVLWLLGYPDQALEKSSEAVSWAQKSEHPFSLALALSFAAWLHQFRQEMHLTYERAESALALSTEKGFGFWKGWEMVLQGWAINAKGADKKKIEMIRQGLDTWRASGSELGRPYFLALMAEVCGKAGQTNNGLQFLVEALQLVDSTEERWCQAELHRLKGELLLSESSENQDEAETCLQRALRIARHQQAKSLELKTAISLTRLWLSQGKNKQSKKLLHDTFSWFTEGFETVHLKEAKELLGSDKE